MALHPFERAGLGVAPFHAVGFRERVYQPHPDAPRRPGGTCDYCGRAITYEVLVEGADGSRFGVGTDCAEKVWGEGKERLLRFIDEEKRALTKERRRLLRESKRDLSYEEKLFARLEERAREILSTEFAVTYAELFVQALAKHRAPAGKVWVGGNNVRVYLPKRNYVIVTGDGAIEMTYRDQLTLDLGKLSPPQQDAFEAAVVHYEADIPEVSQVHDLRVLELAEQLYNNLG